VLKVWRSDTGACVYTHQGSSSSLLQQAGGGSSSSSSRRQTVEDRPAAAGNELVELLLLPGGKGLLAATGRCPRSLFYYPQVRGARFHFSAHDQLTRVGAEDKMVQAMPCCSCVDVIVGFKHTTSWSVRSGLQPKVQNCTGSSGEALSKGTIPFVPLLKVPCGL